MLLVLPAKKLSKRARGIMNSLRVHKNVHACGVALLKINPLMTAVHAPDLSTLRPKALRLLPQTKAKANQEQPPRTPQGRGAKHFTLIIARWRRSTLSNRSLWKWYLQLWKLLTSFLDIVGQSGQNGTDLCGERHFFVLEITDSSRRHVSEETPASSANWRPDVSEFAILRR